MAIWIMEYYSGSLISRNCFVASTELVFPLHNEKKYDFESLIQRGCARRQSQLPLRLFFIG